MLYSRITMLKNIKKIILLFTVCFTFSFSIAQPTKNGNDGDKYRAAHWNVNNGLAHDKTYCMLKDVYGFLWIGTDGGLSRFDGSTFKNYYYDPGKKESIAGIAVFGLVEDSLNNIWIGTDKGLTCYDIKADTLTNFFSTTMTLFPFIVPFSATKDEVYCRESDSLITVYNIHTFAKKNLITLTPEDKLAKGGNYSIQNSIFDPSSNSVWILSFSGNTGLLQISLSTGKRERYGWAGNNYAEAMCYDHKRNSIWINTDGGLFEFSLHDKQAHHIDALKELEKQKSTGHIGIGLDPSGRVWFLTYPQGIIIYDPKEESFHPVFEKDSVLQKSISATNGCIYCDRDGIAWSGFWLRYGVWQLAPISPVVSSGQIKILYVKRFYVD